MKGKESKPVSGLKFWRYGEESKAATQRIRFSHIAFTDDEAATVWDRVSPQGDVAEETDE